MISGNPTHRSAIVAWQWMTSYCPATQLPSPHILAAATPRNGGTRSASDTPPNTVLEQFRDEAHLSTFRSMQANVLQSFPTTFTTKHLQSFSYIAWVDLDDLKEWFRQQADLNHLLDPTISEAILLTDDSHCGFHPMPMNVPPVGLNPRFPSGMDANFSDAMFMKNTHHDLNSGQNPSGVEILPGDYQLYRYKSTQVCMVGSTYVSTQIWCLVDCSNGNYNLLGEISLHNYIKKAGTRSPADFQCESNAPTPEGFCPELRSCCKIVTGDWSVTETVFSPTSSEILR
ncbi:hypothetical protein DFH08DRAFT_801641 [Mycena albidolilacea]|uniref:Uncharacterized protein n=1 Tax=Mycena albidolilacea TaxID=1033008 RepID=A0AAD7EZJ8_9AGAR|nr:hypothetical protein DFH08DRAFT_801641 [Mycena albidolilacea]